MWANLQNGRDNNSNYARNNSCATSPSSALLLPPSLRKNNAPIIKRQTSKQSSVRSTSSYSNIQKKIEEHFLHSQTEDWKKEQEYKVRRLRWKQRQQQMDSKKKLQYARYLYVPACVFIGAGSIMLLGAILRSISEGTIFYTHREQFKYIGPIVLVVGIIILFIAIGVEANVTEQLKSDGVLDIVPVIHPDFKLEQIAREKANNSSGQHDTSIRRSRSAGILKSSGLCDSFNSAAPGCSLPSNPSSPTDKTTQDALDFSQRWANAMNVQIDDVEAGVEETLPSINVVVSNETNTHESPDGNGKQLDRLPSMPDSGVSFTVTDYGVCEDEDSRMCHSSVDSLYETETRFTYM